MIVSRSKAEEAAGILALDEHLQLVKADVVRAFHNKAKECHPDHHGNEKLEQWSRITWAKAVLEGWLEKNAPEQSINEPECFTCKGEGRIKVRRVGFGTPLTVQCTRCRGTGTLSGEENDADWS